MVKGGLIQCSVSESSEKPIEVIKKSMIDKHIALIEEAGKKAYRYFAFRKYSSDRLLRRAKNKMVCNGRKNSRRTDGKTDAGVHEKDTQW